MNVSDFVALLRDFLGRTDLTDAQLLRFVNLGLAKLQRNFGFQYPKTSGTTAYASGGIALPSNWKGFPNDRCVTYTTSAGVAIPAIHTRWENIVQRRGGTNDTRLYSYVRSLGTNNTLLLSPEPTDGGQVSYVYTYLLPDYVIGGGSDDILNYGSDVLLLLSMMAHNIYAQEEQKVPVNAQLVQGMLDEFYRAVAMKEQSGSMVDV